MCVMTMKNDTKIEEEMIFILKLTWGIWQILTRVLESLQNLKFKWAPFDQCIYNVWAKEVQRSYLSWHWRVIQNLKENRLVVWRMRWRIWEIFIKALESVKSGTLMGSFCPKWKMYELKIYREVICHDNEEWYKIWRTID